MPNVQNLEEFCLKLKNKYMKERSITKEKGAFSEVEEKEYMHFRLHKVRATWEVDGELYNSMHAWNTIVARLENYQTHDDFLLAVLQEIERLNRISFNIEEGKNAQPSRLQRAIIYEKIRFAVMKRRKKND